MSRPSSVTVIAWSWIVSGVLMVLAAVLTWAAQGAMQQMMGAANTAMPPGLAPALMLSGNAALSAAVQLILGLVAIVAGAAFLRLAPWARAALEGLSWLALLYVVGFGISWTYTWFTMTAPLRGQGNLQSDFATLGLVVGAVIIAILAIPIVAMIKSLRGRVVREALRQSPAE